MTDFISGLDLNERFFHEVVRPLLAVHFPDLPYAAAVRAAIQDEQIRQLPRFGSLDQFSDNTDLRSYPPYGRRLRPLYQT